MAVGAVTAAVAAAEKEQEDDKEHRRRWSCARLAKFKPFVRHIATLCGAPTISALPFLIRDTSVWSG